MVRRAKLEEGRRVFHVYAGPDRVARAVQHLGRDGADQETAKGAASMSGHHDEVNIIGVGIRGDA